MPTHGTGVFAMNSGRAFVAHGKVKKKRVRTSEQREQEEFFNTHDFAIGRDSKGNPVVKITEKE